MLKNIIKIANSRQFLACTFVKSLPNALSYCSNSSNSTRKIAVVLSGNGVFDGTEITEATSVNIHLSRNCVETHFFAPNKDQMHVVNHLKGCPEDGECRNVLIESARLARGKVKDLCELKECNFDAVIFPGGFGVAKNLSTFAINNVKCTVDPTVERIIKSFYCSNKPIGMSSIAPVLAARVLRNVCVTVGSNIEEGGKWPYAATAKAIEEMRAHHVVKGVNDIFVDEITNLVTTPGTMCDSCPIHEIHDGIGKMVRAVLELISTKEEACDRQCGS